MLTSEGQRRADIEVLNIGLAQKRDLLLDITQRHDFMVLNATVVAAMGTCVIWTIPIDLEEAEKKNQEHRESMAAAEARGHQGFGV